MLAFGGFTAKEAASRVVQYTEWKPGGSGDSDIENHGDRCTLVKKNKWKLPTPLCENGACVVNNILYIAGLFLFCAF